MVCHIICGTQVQEDKTGIISTISHGQNIIDYADEYSLSAVCGLKFDVQVVAI